MNFDLSRIFITSKKDYNDNHIPSIINGAINTFDDSQILNVTTVYTCIKILSETISKLPLEIYRYDDKVGNIKDKDNYLYSLLHYAPNNYTTSQSFFSTLETHRNLKGNSFAKIIRNIRTGKVESLKIINPSDVKGYFIKNNELYYKILEDRSEIVVNGADILHFKMISRDGIWGLNPIESLRTLLSITHKGLNTIDNYYSNNAATTKVLKTILNTGGAERKNLIESLQKFNDEFVGSNNAGKPIILPPNTELSELSLNLADSQFIETVKFNSNQIASLYGVPPHLIGFFEASKFNNVEQLQMNFKVSTISNIVRMYRQELEFKLLTDKERKEGVSIEFNTNSMLELDNTTKMNQYKTLANIGVISPNYIAKLENLPVYDGGDQHLINASSTTVEGLLKKIDNEGGLK